MVSKIKWIILVISLSLICTTYGDGEAENDQIPSEQLPTDLPNQALVNTVNEFGYKLLTTVMKNNKEKNIVISPTSIAGLLAMTLLGSVGNTYDELAKSLGFSQDIFENRINHETLGKLLQSLNMNTSTSKTLYADVVFVDKQTQMRESYRSYLSRVYRGDALNVEFKQKEMVKDVINEWVKNHTDGKLDNFLLKPLPEQTKLVLLSALYFSGQWAVPFVPEYTTKMPFNTTSNKIMVDLMLNFGNFDYIFSTEEQLHMLKLPYNDSVTNMYILKPIFSNSLSNIMDRIDYSKIDSLINQMTPKKSVVRFPKMDIESKIWLEDPLKNLGIRSLFKQGDANFALMVNSDDSNEMDNQLLLRLDDDKNTKSRELLRNMKNPGLHVDSVIHNVKLSINEYGTEAAAATSGILARTANLFYVDSPFLIFIRNENTKLVTFSAVIYNPAEKFA